MSAQPAEGASIPYSDVQYVFGPNERTRPPLEEYLGDLWDRRRFLVTLAKSELRGQRSSTFLGELWGLLDPIFMATIYFFLITLLRGRGASAEDNAERLAILVGCIFLFSFSQTAITDGARSILKNQGLMLNSTFPRALLPLASVYRAGAQLLPAIAIYAVVHTMLGLPVGLSVTMLPLLFVIQVVLSTGLALLFATLTVFLRDTTNILGYVMRVLFFATPILYKLSTLSPTMQTVLLLNPFFGIFASYQTIIIGETPQLLHVVHGAALAVAAMVVGYRTFVSNERSFALRL